MNARGLILSLIGLSVTVSVCTAGAITRESVKLFDGKNVQCLFKSDIGNASFEISKTGQVTQEDGILISFVATSKVCTSVGNRLVMVESLPPTVLPDGVTIEYPKVVVGPVNAMDNIDPLAVIDLDSKATKTEFEVLVPKNLSGKSVDSYVSVQRTDNFGVSESWLVGYRHKVR